MKKIIIVTLLLISQKVVLADDIFYWKWQLTNGQIKITGSINHQTEKTVYAEATITKKRFALLYWIIDYIEYPKYKVFQKTVDTLSSLLVGPFSSDISKCRSIIVDLDTSLLNFPIEFLKLKTESIALIRPMVFTIAGNQNDPARESVVLHKGCIIRDPTSDPENACINIFHSYPGSEFKSAYKITEKDLGLKTGIDFILISAHGDADSITFRGGIALNKIDNVKPGFFKENNSKVVYVDACQQGINWTYISALAETKEPNFYLGPIISNDSGESSTKTINWFFSFLKQTQSPVTSIWETRKKLYRYYNKKINAMDVINKSFIFRIYKI